MKEGFHATVKRLLANGDPINALKLMEEASKSNKEVNDIMTMILFDYYDLEKQKITGVIDSKDAGLRQSIINDKILNSLIYFSEKGTVLLNTVKPVIKEKKSNSFSGTAVLAILSIAFGGLCYYGIKTNNFDVTIGALLLFFLCFISLLIALILSVIRSKS